MAQQKTEGTPFEKSAITILLRGLGGQELLDALRNAEAGWSNSTYYRRMDEACRSLETRGAATRSIGRDGNIEWTLTPKIADILSPNQLAEHCVYLSLALRQVHAQLGDLSVRFSHVQRQADLERSKASQLQKEMDEVKASQQHCLETRLSSRFPELGLNRTWLEALVLLALVEIMARHKLAMLLSEPSEAEDKKFTDLLNSLKENLPLKEGREFAFNSDLVKGLYAYRNKMIHNGLSSEIRPKEVEGIAA